MATPSLPQTDLRRGRRWILALASAVLIAATARAEEAPSAAGRQVETIDGIRIEYSPGQEELARLIGERFAEYRRTGEASGKDAPLTPDVPLSPAEMRANRSRYLAGICGQLALKQPTAFQEECYEAFLDNYEMHMRLLETMYQALAEVGGKIDRLTLWDRTELAERLKQGEAISGFRYDTVDQKVRADFNLPVMNRRDERMAEISARREQLKHEYTFRIASDGGGASTYHGSVTTGKKKPQEKKEAQPDTPQDAKPMAYPVVIPAELAAMCPAELATKLWEGEILRFFGDLKQAAAQGPKIDPNIAYLVLHETTEVGIMDRYYRGKDRRWLCDGVANYVPWRVVRDLHGLDAARKVYNVEAQLARYAEQREKINLRQWAATEHQAEGVQETALNRAHYAYAAQVVFLMNARAGEDVLSRLFTEIGRTKRDKVSMKTVEKAWQKVSGTKLDVVLADAVKAPPVKKPDAEPKNGPASSAVSSR